MLRVLLVEPMKKPKIVEIEHDFHEMQKLVGGLIQAVYPWNDMVALVCDDEGKLKGYPPNRMVERYGPIAGTFFICGIGDEDFISISDELAEKYMKMFSYPEIFFADENGYICCIKLAGIEL